MSATTKEILDLNRFDASRTEDFPLNLQSALPSARQLWSFLRTLL